MLDQMEEEIVSWYSTQFVPCAPSFFCRGDQDVETDLNESRGTGFSLSLSLSLSLTHTHTHTHTQNQFLLR